MKAEYNAEVNALYVRLTPAKVSESEEVRPGIVFDFDDEERLVGIEILDAADHLTKDADLKSLVPGGCVT